MRQEKVPDGIGIEQLENVLNVPLKTQRECNPDPLPLDLRFPGGPGL
jgi:hypothetical protein